MAPVCLEINRFSLSAGWMVLDEVVEEGSPPVLYESAWGWSWSMEGLPLEVLIFTSCKGASGVFLQSWGRG